MKATKEDLEKIQCELFKIKDGLDDLMANVKALADREVKRFVDDIRLACATNEEGRAVRVVLDRVLADRRRDT